MDAQGLTVMPGFIDAHRHIVNGHEDQWFKDQASARMRLVEGGPLDLIHSVLNVKVTIKGGVVVHDARKR